MKKYADREVRMDREKYKQAFSVLHASKNITWENMQKNAEKFERGEMSMSRVEEKSRRILGMRPLAAAVCGCMILVLIGGGSVYALKPVSGLFSKVFQISDRTKETVDKMGRAIGDSVTSNGITVTAEGVLKDSHHYAVIYSVSRADGKELSESADYQDKTFGFREIEDGTEASGSYFFSYHDKKKDSAIQIAYVISNVEKLPEVLEIHLSDLLVFTCSETETIAKGSWKFRLSLPHNDSSILLAENKTVKMKSPAGEAELVLNEISVSPIGYSFKISRKNDKKISLQKFAKIVESGEWKLELKDGTFIDFYGGTAITEKEDKRDYWVSSGTFDERIIPVSEMKSIHMNNIEIPVP